MNQVALGVLAAASLIFCTNSSSAAVLTFDDAWTVLGDGGDPATFYSSEGVTISGDNAGVWGGNGNGNPGAWQLQGTNGSAFLGCNNGNSCSPTFTFSSPVRDISLDIGLANNWSATFTVSGYMNSSLVDSDTITISNGNDGGGTWDTFALKGNVNEVVVTDAFSSGFAYGLDNVGFSPATSGAPEPASWAMLLVGFGMLGAVARRRTAAFRSAR